MNEGGKKTALTEAAQNDMPDEDKDQSAVIDGKLYRFCPYCGA